MTDAIAHSASAHIHAPPADTVDDEPSETLRSECVSSVNDDENADDVENDVESDANE